MTGSGPEVARGRWLLVAGIGSLAIGMLVLRRHSRGSANTERDSPRESNWSRVRRDDPNLREARSML